MIKIGVWLLTIPKLDILFLIDQSENAEESFDSQSFMFPLNSSASACLWTVHDVSKSLFKSLSVSDQFWGV